MTTHRQPRHRDYCEVRPRLSADVRCYIIERQNELRQQELPDTLGAAIASIVEDSRRLKRMLDAELERNPVATATV